MFTTYIDTQEESLRSKLYLTIKIKYYIKTRYIIIYLSFHEKIIIKFAIFMSINDVYNLYDV